MKYSTLKEFISSDRETEKILIVRDRHWATDELDLCALDGTPSVGVHVMTLEEVLSEYGGFEKFLTESESFVILEKVLRQLQRQGELKYYAAHLNSPTLTEELRKTVFEIRMSDADQKRREPSHIRTEELLKLTDGYEAELSKLGRKDLASCWREIRGEEMSSNYQYAVYADTSVSYLERRFLDALPNLAVLTVARVSVPVPKTVYSEEGVDDSVRHYFENDSMLLKCHELRFERHYLAGQEVRSIFEDLQRKKISPAEVEIVYADPSYARLLSECAKMFSVSVEMGDGIDISVPLLSDWLSAFEKFCRSKCGLQEFDRLLSRRFFRFTDHALEKLMEAFRKRNFRAGRENYNFPEELSPEVPGEMSELCRFLRELLGLVPKSMFEIVSWKEYGDRLRMFLSRYARTTFEEKTPSFSKTEYADEEELRRQLDMWEEHWKTVFDEEMNYARIFHRLRKMCAVFPVRKPSFKFPSVLIRGLTPLRPWKRKNCYLCGLTANAFPKVIGESPVLNDEERAQLSNSLSTSETRNDEEKYQIQKFMASFSNTMYTDRGRTLYFSCPMFDLSTNTEVVSSLLPERWARAYGEEGWTNFGFYSDQEAEGAESDVFVWEKISEEERKDTEKFFQDFVFSSSSLEQLMKCPQCFYYKYVMHLSKKPEEETDEWEWLDSKNKGILCHEILNVFFKRREGENKVSADECRRLFLDVIDEEVRKARAKNPPARRRVFEDAVLKVRDALSLYFNEVLAEELQKFSKFYSEQNFNEKIMIGKYPIRLSGRVDLLCLRESEMLIVDFKTGKRSGIEEKSRSDELIQDMLYSEAMHVHYGRDGKIRTEYHFPFLEFKKMRFSETDPVNRFQRRKEKIEKMIDLILEYGFVSSKQLTEVPTGYEILRKNPKDVEKAHSYSDFKDICR